MPSPSPIIIPEASTCRIEDLHSSVNHQREMSLTRMDSLMQAIRAFGFVQPIVARGSDGLVIGGNKRLEAYKRICQEDGVSPKEVPVVWIECTDEQAMALSHALNNVSGGWDMGLLSDVTDVTV